MSVFSGIYQFRVPESSKSGTPVGRIRATDRDIGKNAEMYFTIVSGDGMDMFDISTDKDTQEGVISVSKVRLNCGLRLLMAFRNCLCSTNVKGNRCNTIHTIHTIH